MLQSAIKSWKKKHNNNSNNNLHLLTKDLENVQGKLMLNPTSAEL